MLSAIFWVPWLDHNMLFYLSGSSPLQDVIQVNTYPVHRKKTWIIASFLLTKVYLHYQGLHFCFPLESVITSATLKCSADRFSYIIHILLWLFLCKGRWMTALSRSFWILQTAEAVAVSLVSDVCEWSHEISHSSLSRSQSKSHFFFFFLQLKCSRCINVFSADTS